MEKARHQRLHQDSGLGALWIVTTASKDSTLGDILFQATAKGFAIRIGGGLDPDDILGWFDDHSEANQIALQELHRRDGAEQIGIKGPGECEVV